MFFFDINFTIFGVNFRGGENSLGEHSRWEHSGDDIRSANLLVLNFRGTIKFKF